MSTHDGRSITVSRSGSSILIHEDDRFSGSNNCVHCQYFPCRINRYYQGPIEDCKLWNRTDPSELLEIEDYRKEGQRFGTVEEQPGASEEALSELRRAAEEQQQIGELAAAAESFRQAAIMASTVDDKVDCATRAGRLLIRLGDRQAALRLLGMIRDKIRETRDHQVLRRWESTYLTLHDELGGYVGTGQQKAATPLGRILADLSARLRRGPGTDRAELKSIVSYLEELLGRREERGRDPYRWLSNLSSICAVLGDPQRADATIVRVLSESSTVDDEAAQLAGEILRTRQKVYRGEVKIGCERFEELLSIARTIETPGRHLEYLGYYLEALSRCKPIPDIGTVKALSIELRQGFEELLLDQPGSLARKRLREHHQRTFESAVVALLATGDAQSSGAAEGQQILGELWQLVMSSRNPELRGPAIRPAGKEARQLLALEDSFHRALHYHLTADVSWSLDEFLEKVVDHELSMPRHAAETGVQTPLPPEDGLALAFFQLFQLFPSRPLLVLGSKNGRFQHHWIENAEEQILGPLQRWWDRIEASGRIRRTAAERSMRLSRKVGRQARPFKAVSGTTAVPSEKAVREWVGELLPKGILSTSNDENGETPALTSCFIFPDGALHTLPVEMLPSPDATSSIGQDRTVYCCLRPRVIEGIEDKIDLSHGWLGVGGAPEVMAWSEVPQIAFSRLPGTLEEVEAIRADLQQLGYPVATLTGDAAHVDNLLAQLEELQPEVVHLAVHGHADKDLPDSCALILAPAPGAAEAELLPFRRVRELPLANTRLVVLSACSSLLGRTAASAGMEGLAWAFLEAGAAQVVASRYSVDDEETCLLMRVFYRHLLDAPPAEALRRTRIECLERLKLDPREVGAWSVWS